MSLTHCPLCLALAVVSTARGLTLALLFWQLRADRRRPGEARCGLPRPGNVCALVR